MESLLRFFKDYETLIYLILGAGAAVSLRALLSAWSEWRLAVFGLEKELIFQRVRISGSFFLLFVLIALSQFCLVTFIAPYLPASTFIPTATLSLTAPAGVPPQSNPSPVNATAIPTPPGSVGCLPNQLIFTFPQPGEALKGKITPRVTVNLPDLGFFKYEYAVAGSDEWMTIAADNQIKIDGELNLWDTSLLTPGDYQLRLVATNNLGETLPPCIIPIRIVAP
ncbi:MAG: hypothetical protein DDG60_06270 [Anaerolineae bacterium]|nr:MAG: hypothetical protein DDG60_06270 [Anaerolineae bacterium]